MDSIKTNKTNIIIQPGLTNFWNRFVSNTHPGLGTRCILFIFQFLSQIYKVGLNIRYILYAKGIISCHKVSVPVLSVGNITTGGTGKTPFSILLANYFNKKGKNVSIISRGYHRESNIPVQVVSDGNSILHDTTESGDEPFLMAKKCPGVPVIVGKNRYKACQESIKRFKSELIILDDGYQHLGLYRDANILLLDDKNPFYGNHLLPRGNLREPAGQISRAHFIFRIRKPVRQTEKDNFSENSEFDHAQTLYYEPFNLVDMNLEYLKPLEYLQTKCVILFCGIGNPDPFIQRMLACGARIPETFIFGDHHKYTKTDLETLSDAKDRWNADLCLTTEKDIVKIARLNWSLEMAAVSMGFSSPDSDCIEDFFLQIETFIYKK